MKKTAWMILSMIAAIGVVSAPAFAREPDGEGDKVVEAEHYSVTVPEEIAKIAEIEVNGDAVSFREKISFEKFGGGFAGEYALYESMLDYQGMPEFRRGGQIELSDGTKLDVLLLYPTDVQFDPEDSQSSENYKKISEAFSNVILDSFEATDGVYTPQDQINTDDIYADTLQKLSDDLAAGKDREGFEEDGFSYLYAYFSNQAGNGDQAPAEEELSESGEGTLSEQAEEVLSEEAAEALSESGETQDSDRGIGYAYLDLNGDGYDELLIGRVGDDAIYDLFTQIDGEVYHVFSGGERSVYKVMSHDGEHTGMIRKVGSGGASLTNITFYLFSAAEEDLFPQLTYVYDETADPENPYSIIYGDDIDSVPITEARFNEVWDGYGKPLQIAYTPLG